MNLLWDVTQQCVIHTSRFVSFTTVTGTAKAAWFTLAALYPDLVNLRKFISRQGLTTYPYSSVEEHPYIYFTVLEY